MMRGMCAWLRVLAGKRRKNERMEGGRITEECVDGVKVKERATVRERERENKRKQ